MASIRFARVIVLALATLAASFAAGAQDQFVGRPVAEIIDDFRAQGLPFAYSTNLLRSDMLVIAEPTATEPLEIAEQILAPFELTIRQEFDFYLVVRSGAGPPAVGDLLLIIRQKMNWQPLQDPLVTATPGLPDAQKLGSGVRQYAGLSADRYHLVVEAEGFEPQARTVTIRSGKMTVADFTLDPVAPELEVVTVSSSRYALWYELTSSPFSIDQRSIQNLPDLGDDPLRAAQRLPGAASNGVSARTYLRGGEQNETGMILNGHKLFDPFHVRDFQSVFSSIDPRVIDGIDVHTGGFPVMHGDQMSGLIEMDSVNTTRMPGTEIGVSLFNTSLLSAGSLADGRGHWLASARRSNLELIVGDHGSPSYFDIFGELAFDLTPNADISLNVLFADDRIDLVLADNEEEIKRAESDTRNADIWLRLRNQWTEELSSSSVLSFNDFANQRTGLIDDPEDMTAKVYDVRNATQFGFRQDWAWSVSPQHYLQWGFALGYGNADYDYRSDVEYFEFSEYYPDLPNEGIRNLQAAPAGGSYALHVSDKWKLADKTFLELGLRWDNQNYTGLGSDPQLSPRVSLFQAFGKGTEFRVSWGRYYQSQGIHELQIEDGVTEMFPAQRADHFIVALRQALGKDYSLRLELYQKDMDRLRPRFENLFNPLELLPEVERDRIRIAPASAMARGIEVLLEHERSGPWSWWGSYSISEVTDSIDGQDEKRAWDQTHSFKAGVSLTTQNWDFGLAVNAHTGWPTTSLRLVEDIDADGELVYLVVPGPRNAERFKAFATVDARLSRRFDLGDSLLTTFVEVSNAFDRDNECCVDFEIDEDDDGNATLIREIDYWLPLLPSIGFLWEF